MMKTPIVCLCVGGMCALLCIACALPPLSLAIYVESENENSYVAAQLLQRFLLNDSESSLTVDINTVYHGSDLVDRVYNTTNSVGIIRADLLYNLHTVNNENPVSRYPQLRSVIMLYPLTIQILLPADIFIDETVPRLNAAPLLVGDDLQTILGLITQDIFNISEHAFNHIPQIRTEDISAPEWRQHGAIVFADTHPSTTIQTLERTTQQYRILPISATMRSELVSAYPFLTSTRISIAHYKNLINGSDIPTVSVGVVLFATTTIAPEIIAQICQSLSNNFTEYRYSYPQFEQLSAQAANNVLGIPQHPRAHSCVL